MGNSLPNLERTNQETTLRRWGMACLLTGVTIVGAHFAVPLPFTPVPITFQVFAVLLSGLLLGSRWGALAQVQYLMLGLLNAPVFALGKFGLGVFLWPNVTGGYLLSYPIAAFVAGWIVERSQKSRGGEDVPLSAYCLASTVGLAVIYTLGCSWLALLSRPMLLPMTAVLAGAGWFLFWDAFKALAAIGIARNLRSRNR